MRIFPMKCDVPRMGIFITDKGRFKRSWRHPFNAKLQTKLCPILNGKCLQEGCMAWKGNGRCKMMGDVE
jgi:hypothetical protein